MASDPDTQLPSELELALAYTPAHVRAAMHTFFALDQRLARIVSATTEPMLGQMRLAWWRDMLGTAPADRPKGDAVLDAIGEHWVDQEKALTELVNGWEEFVVAEKLGPEETRQFAGGRAHPFTRFLEAGARADEHRVETSSMRWALADAASRVSDEGERAAIVDLASDLPAPTGRHPKSLRGLAVLDALAVRALKRGGRPLMEGRGASLTALRAGILGA